MRQLIFFISLLLVFFCITIDEITPKNNKHNNSLLFKACNKGDYKTVEKLIKQGIDINQKAQIDEISDGTPLILCSIVGQESIAELLINNGADVNIKNNLDETPLMLVSLSGSLKIAELLIANNAKINEQNQEGQTALIFSVNKNHTKIVELLIKNNADVNISDNYGSSPLMYAVSHNLFDIVKILVENNADVNAKDKEGKTVLKFVKDWDSLGDSSFIIINGKTSIQYNKKNAEDIKKYLIEHGAE